MKKIKILILVAILSITYGCKKYTEGFEVSPNSPSQVTPSLLLSHCELAVMVHYTGQLARVPSILMQQSAGTDFQFIDVASYLIQEGDNVNEWNSIYADGLSSLKRLIEVSGDANPHYRGIAKVIKAMELGLATDIWGDVPNSEALLGESGAAFYNPHFDTQQSIIADIQSILSSAIVDLDPAKSNILIPGSDDFIHGGDVAKWTKTAWMLKARYANRLSKRDANGSATDALSYIASAGLTGSADDAHAVFGTNGNELNQWYSFNLTRSNYMKMGKYLMELLKSTSDPRLSFYATTDEDGNYTGTAPDSTNTNTSNLGAYYGSSASPLPLVTYAEMKFIEAEANLRLSNAQAAADAHNAAVIASVEKVTGATIDSVYLIAQASETSGTITLEKIMTQKYVAMFTQVEVWSDWRRTNFPTLTPNPDGVVNSIPRRFVTSFDERISNVNAIIVTDILLPVWWDE